jgi:voltage-gated potassium channel
MSSSRAFWAGMTVLAAVTGVGTLGFMIFENVGVFDAFYTTVITLTTVGFGELEGGFSTAGRVLAIFVVIGGVGSAFYTATQGLELAFERFIGGESQSRRTRRTVNSLSNHIILCGIGRVGRSVLEDLKHRSLDVVVIEIDPERAEWARDRDVPVVLGDATHNANLLEAGIEKARGVVAAVRHDSDNLVITLSSKSLNPDVVVVARSDNVENAEKTLLAGADQVVAPQVVGAKRLAALVDRPQLVEFIDLVVGSQVVQVEIEKCLVTAGAELDGRSLRVAKIRSKVGALILGIEDPETGALQLNPNPDTVIKSGNVLLALGSDAQLRALHEIASSTA